MADGPASEDPRSHPDPNEFRVVNALRSAIPTVRHAAMLFDVVVDHLGDEGYIETVNDGAIRLLLRRTAPGSATVFPWPLLTLSYVPVPVVDLFGFGLEPAQAPRPRAEVAPKLRGMKAGYVVLRDGAVSLTVAYRDDGLWKETARDGSRETLAGLVPALAAGGADPVEIVAALLGRLDISRNGTGRVHLPVALPGGANGLWQGGVQVIRKALYEGRLPSAPSWIVVDGYEKRIFATGDAEASAMAAWREQVKKRPPMPPAAARPPETTEPEEPWDDSQKEIQEQIDKGAWRWDARWPAEPSPETTPAVIVRLDACPLPPHPWGTWLRVLGPCGENVYGLQHFHPDGWTLVGQDLVDRIDVAHVDEVIDGLGDSPPRSPGSEGEAWKQEEAPYDCWTAFYRFTDDVTGRLVPPYRPQAFHGEGFNAETLLDGAVVRKSVVRQRWTT